MENRGKSHYYKAKCNFAKDTDINNKCGRGNAEMEGEII